MPQLRDYTPLLLCLCAAFAALSALVLRRLNRSVLSRLQGPKPESLLLGNQMQFEISPLGERDHEWFKEFGRTFKFTGGLGENVLYTSDPKALQFILQTSAYGFEKPPTNLIFSRRALGPGVLGVEFDDHKRLRKVMLPAFQLPQTRALVPVFQNAAASLVSRLLSENLVAQGDLVINVHTWLAKATLDAIGEAAFGTKFGALDEDDNKLAKNFKNMILRARGGQAPTSMKVTITNLFTALPPSFASFLFLLQRTRTRVSEENRKTIFETGRELFKLTKKEGEVSLGNGEKDVMSLLVQSNLTENPKTSMSEEEVLGSMGAVMFAGHETTASTTTFALWELAKHPQVQDKLRSEITAFYAAALDRGEMCIPSSDYEKMEYTQAVVKETLRFHPLVPQQSRTATKDTVVPLSRPVITKDGVEISEIPLKKGTRTILSLTQYNRLEDIWGSDSYSYNPDRWTNMNSKEVAVRFGVLENLGTFGAGIHACIGWRFAVYEFQTFLIELIHNFRFELTPEAKTVRKAFGGLAVPIVEGNDKEANMPLRVVAIKVEGV